MIDFFCLQFFLSSPDLEACALNVSNGSESSITSITSTLNISITDTNIVVCDQESTVMFFPQVRNC